MAFSLNWCLSPDQVKLLPIQRGNEQRPLGEFFDVEGSASEDEELIWIGDCSKVKYIGAYWMRGRIKVLGNSGMHLGAEMTGGGSKATPVIGWGRKCMAGKSASWATPAILWGPSTAAVAGA
jgi:hypothetical protein